MLSKADIWRITPVGLALLAGSFMIAGQEVGGLQPGAKAPSFTLQDQSGKTQNLSSLTGPKGLVLLFFRSADWCPFCKGQLVDLERSQSAFAAKGIQIAALSYDSPAILADFAKRRSITYPLLSNPTSSVIDAFGIRNTQATGMQVGIPYPGYYLIDPDGMIEKRFFGSGVANRWTASNVYDALFNGFSLPAPSRQLDATPHVTVTTSQSDDEVTPGFLVQLLVSLTPGPETHVYAAGAEKMDYRPVSVKIDASDLYAAQNVSYPAPETMNFPELHQVVPVYTGKTVLSTIVSAQVNPKTMPSFAKESEMRVTGQLEYQACTATVCFPPVKAALEWTVKLRPLDRDRVPEAIQHK